MKRFSVVFVVQADTIEEATKQAKAFLKTPIEASGCPIDNGYHRPTFEVRDDDASRHIEPALHLPMIACKTCGKKLVNDGWVQFCGEECYDGS